jgi:hypothetical protein
MRTIKKREPLPPYFIALDGEGITLGSRHLYTLLADSEGNAISDLDGLSTTACFDYLMMLGEKYKKPVYVSFYFSYDVTKILEGLDPKSLTLLNRDGWTFVTGKSGSYYIEYMPRKQFTISRAAMVEGKMKRKAPTIRIYDTFGFFQSSFLKALKEFGIGTPEELAIIEDMKLRRDSFDEHQTLEVLKYNRLECDLLVRLMNQVSRQLLRFGLRLTSWHGAGAVAAAVLAKESVKNHLYTPPDDTDELNAVKCGYFGGRVYAPKIGEYRNVHSYDINSAYPSAMVEFPSLANGSFVRRLTNRLESNPVTIYKIAWDFPKGSVTAFPFRLSDGRIDYPLKGKGWYWSYEVEAVMKHYPERVTILESYMMVGNDLTVKPFNFIREYYEFRQDLKASGDMMQLVIKLALNSLYGKLAQGKGYKGRRPPYQCYIYAGMVTSYTRGKLFSATHNKSGSIISFATDGILSLEDLPVTVNKELGGWDYGKYDKALMIKPGIYSLMKDGKTSTKIRGFRSIDFPELERLWNEFGVAGEYVESSSKFVGMKQASENSPYGTWLDSVRKLSFMPSRGEPILESREPLQYRLDPPGFISGYSAPYTKGGLSEVEEQEIWSILDEYER